MNEELAHIAVSPLADAEKFLLSSGRVFPWHEAQPGGQITSSLELSAVANRCKKCGGSQRFDPRGRHEPSCDILATGDRLDLACDVTNALFQLTQAVHRFRILVAFERL